MRRIPIEQRRAELIAAAIRVISRDGLAAATTRSITAEAEMPLGAFHYVFASRDELVSAVIDEVTEAERTAAMAHVEIEREPEERDIASILRLGLEGYLAELEASPSSELALFEVALHAVRHDPGSVAEQWETYRLAAEETLTRAAELAGIRWTSPVADLAHSLTSSLDGLTVTWLADRDGAAARAHIRFLAAAFAAMTVPDSPLTSATPLEGGIHAH